jgi:hypothetical protein
VYRSSFLDSLTIGGLWGIDWPGGGVRTVGPIVYRPLNPPVVLDLLDHLWIQHLYHGGSVLLRRQLEDRENEIVLTTHEASIVFGDFGVCDVIHQMITTYTVWKETGSVSTTRFVLPEVMGRCR